MRRSLPCIAMLSACGRFGFEPAPSAMLGDASQIDAAIDTPSDTTSGTSILRAGDRSDADLRTCRDTWVQDDRPTENFGRHQDIHINASNPGSALLHFTIDNATTRSVTKAELHVWVYQDAMLASSSLQVTRVLEAWTEGTGDFEVGVASYQERMAGTPWTTPGAGAPGSRDATVLGQAMGPKAVGDEIVVELPPALVASWITNPAANHGIALRLAPTPFDYTELYTRETTDETLRPLLVIELGP